MRGMRRRIGRTVVAGALAAVAVGGVVGTAQAADPAYDFESFSTEAIKLDGTTELPFTQAGGHPDLLRVAFRFNARGTAAPEVSAIEDMRDLDIELPAGVQGNPMATPRCSSSAAGRYGMGHCPDASVVGYTTLFYTQGQRGNVSGSMATVYNLEPPEGVTARFAFSIATVTVYIDMAVNDDGRYTISSKIRNASSALVVRGSEMVLFGVPALRNGPGTLPRNLGGRGTGVPIPLLTMGNDCSAPQRVHAKARSWQQPDRWISASVEMPQVTGCEQVPFSSSLSMTPATDQAAAPSGFTAELRVPQESDPDQLSPANLKKVEVALPAGVAINPASAQGLVGCTDVQAKLRESGAPVCPDASKIGTVKIDTPVLPGPLNGFVYLGTPKSMVAANGDMFRVFLAARGFGVTIKQEGRITPDPVTGQLRAVFDDIPQQPFEKLTVNFNGGPRAPLTTPTMCGTHTTASRLTSTTGKVLDSASRFTTACRPGLLGFAPGFAAGVNNILAGASSPLNLSIVKPDGQHALTGVNLKLPKGLLANLKGNLGKPVGTVMAYAGVGSEPFGLPGVAYLEGAYGDAPFSLRVVVPAIAGPYNLGNVVVRQKLYVHPDTAQVTTVSDPLPTILQGVPVQLQRLDVSINRAGFMINPTNCEAQAIVAGLSSAGGQHAGGASRFGLGGCRELPYAPDLGMKLGGPSKELKDGGHPQLNATLKTKKGEANQKKVAVTLPLNLALDPDNAKALCEPSAVATGCPADSIVGKASAVSILDVPLEGPVYFVRGERKTSTGRTVGTLPKLFIPLTGQGVRINLHASSDVVDDKLQTTFDNLPDAPIESFDLQINGGENGILAVTNGDVCKATDTPRAENRFVGQNGKVHRSWSTLKAGCRFSVAKTEKSGGRVTLTFAGLEPGRLSISGKGVQSNRRTIGRARTVAGLGVSVDAATRRKLDAGQTVKLRLQVTLNPDDEKAKSKKLTKTVTLKG